ncbi:hypothetical protein [Actinotalea sp. Marseille-Q4924]|uniref:hypothetical protein n=1 Tax=Actinotalea sp. Marseille-Q4924 TaxID=2866571 RepID=UPI001CE4B079|nr:hypothetical protein [Actinotalea sp. Marseille-Q4924]
MSLTTPTWSRTRRRAARTVAALAVGAALLTGCAQTPGTAAVVDGRTITEATLQEATAELGTLIPQGIPTQQVLINLIAAPFLLDAAAAAGAGVSEAEAVQLAEQLAAQAGLAETPELGDGSLTVLRSTLAQQKLTQSPDAAEVFASFEEELTNADVELSPRYGSFDLTAPGGIVAPERPWIDAR